MRYVNDKALTEFEKTGEIVSPKKCFRQPVRTEKGTTGSLHRSSRPYASGSARVAAAEW